VDDMTRNAIKLPTDDNKLETFKENARKEAAKFDIENIVPLYEEIYQKAFTVA